MTSAYRAMSIAAVCRCLVGRHTVSMNRMSDPAKRSRMHATTRRTRSTGCVVCAAMPMRGRGVNACTSASSRTTSKASRSSVRPPDLDVAALADDDRVVAVADERLHGAVRDVDEQTRGIDDLETEGGCGASTVPTRRAR
jgi:hypothetical protein